MQAATLESSVTEDITAKSSEAPSAKTRKHRFVPGIGLTVRGVVVICIGLFFLLGPVAEGSDIVAAVVAISFIGALLILTLVTLFTGLRLTKRARFDLTLRSTDSSARQLIFAAQKEETLFLDLSRVKIPPGFVLSVTPEFQGSPAIAPELLLRGGTESDRKVPFLVTFPHRGYWSLSALRIVLKDAFGLTGIAWRTKALTVTEVPVEPQQAIEFNFPISGYSGRPGDASHHGGERIGDPYDLKAYSPSDGVRRIAWKLFAKSNELHVRQPEPSVTPEGTVVSFALALDRDDLLARRVVQFHQRVQDAELIMLSGALGMGRTGAITVANTPRQSLELLMETALLARDELKAEENTAEILTRVVQIFVERCRREFQVDVREVLLWCSDRFLSTVPSSVHALSQLGQTLQQHRIQPTFYLTRSSEFFRSSSVGIFGRWFLSSERMEENTAPELSRTGESAGRMQLLEVCQRSGWKVCVDE